MADISKIKLTDDTTVNLKDAQGRTNMDTLIGASHTAGTAVLGTAAWETVATTIEGEGLVTAAIAKAYVDAQFESIHKAEGQDF